MLEASGIAVGGAVDDHERGARRDRDAAELGRHAREPEVALHRALDAQALFDEVRDVLAVLAQQLLELRVVADALQRGAEQAHGRLLSGGEEVGGDARDVDRLGDRAVGKRRGRQAGQHVVARVAPAVLDVRGELLVEELERVVRERLVPVLADGAGLLARPGTEPLAEQFVVALRYAEQVGDDEHGERLAVRADELAVAAVDELVDLTIGEPPHELLVLAQPLRRDQPHQQRAVRGVDRRVEREQLVADRQRVAVLLDERADVVALERRREIRGTARSASCTTRTSSVSL